MAILLEPRTHIKKFATQYLINSIARILISSRVSPNFLTLLGLAIAIGAGILISGGQMLLGGAVMLAGASTDMLDGAVARLSGKTTQFGALLDSLVDRLSEAAILGGLLVYYVNSTQPHFWGIYLTTGVFLISFSVSYIRARSESLGIPGDIGIMARPERVVILGLGLLTGFPLYALGIIATLGCFTAVHRVIHTFRSSNHG